VTVLVTGACGRIGTHVIRQLHALEVAVCGADAVTRCPHLQGLASVTIYPVDVQDLASLVRLVQEQRISRIVHLAAVIGRQYDEQPWLSYAVNLGGTLNVLEAARLTGVERVVMASTQTIYPKITGAFGPPEWRGISEEHAPDPRRPYSIMKLAGEHTGRYFAERYGVQFAALRFSSYYSAERAIGRGQNASDVLNRIILDAVEGNPTRIERGGDQVFDPVYAKDCAHGVICALLSDRPLSGQVYNISGGRGVTLKEAAALVARVLPGTDVTVGSGLNFAPEGAGHHPWLDISKARLEIGYEPQFSLEAGIIDCARELRNLLGLAEQQP
jgi:UDP-glucose 4-epimerase